MLGLLAVITISLSSGWASQYAPGVMERVIAVRQQPGRTAHTLARPLPDAAGYIAVRDCNEIGNTWWIKREAVVEHYQPYMVVDCSGDVKTRDWMQRNHILVEVDYQTAKRWGTIGRGIRIQVRRIQKMRRGGSPVVQQVPL